MDAGLAVQDVGDVSHVSASESNPPLPAARIKQSRGAFEHVRQSARRAPACEATGDRRPLGIARCASGDMCVGTLPLAYGLMLRRRSCGDAGALLPGDPASGPCMPGRSSA